MAARARDAARAVMAARELTEEQLATLAGVSTSHVKRVIECRESPNAALERVLYGASAAPSPVATIAPPSPIAAALAVVQEAMHSEAEQSRDVARSVTTAANGYARAVEESIAHRMLASVGRASGPAPDVHSAALALVSCVQRIPELASLFATPAPVSLPVDPPVVAPVAVDEEPLVEAPAVDESEREAPEQPEPLRWPSLALACARRPIVIVGGTPVPQVTEMLSREGLRVEWPQVAKTGGDRLVQSIEQRLRARTVSALVFVQGFLHHRHSETLRAGAASSSTPTAYAGTGGKSSLFAALTSIEQTIRTRRAS